MQASPPTALLQQYFGHSEFREGQLETIEAVLGGRDVLGIMPTGAGKSVCYQIPALSSRGITLVVSPLISLMKDQVTTLVASGIRAAYINSSLNPAQLAEVHRRARNGLYKIIYVAPERLLTSDFLTFAREAELALLAIDEAHCVSQWGQDFRPSYLRIRDFIGALSRRPPIGAFTATATQAVREVIVRLLDLRRPLITVTGFDRENLYYEVQRPTDKPRALLDLLAAHTGKSGIVYCATRKSVEEVCFTLQQRGFSATRYHAGLTDVERHANQDDFTHDRRTIMVATNAFGMGIDKSNVAFVVHYNMPKNIESYYQEAGRAGRDGSPARCILLYSAQDVRTCKYLIEHAEENPDLSGELRTKIRQQDLERLRTMTAYCKTSDCLREYMLRYFGERGQPHCASCGNCDAQFDTVDISAEARQAIACIHALAGQRRSFGRTMIADLLRGHTSSRVLSMRLDRCPQFGALSGHTARKICDILDHLEAQGYLCLTEDEYPVLRLTERSAELLEGSVTLKIKQRKETARKRPTPSAEADPSLFTALKALRSQLAKEERVPAYIIFSDAALRDMCNKLPQSPTDFLQVSGVGEAKSARYGASFLQAIRDHLANGRMPPDAMPF